MLADIGAMAYLTNADILADRAANVSANSLAPRQSLHCNCLLDRAYVQDRDQMPMPTSLDLVADTVVLADIGSVVW